MQDNWKGIGSYGTVGLEIVLGIVLPCYVGSLADGRYGTGKTWLFVGFLIGVGHAVRVVWRTMKQANQEADAETEREKTKRKQYYEDRDRKL
ncbi:MAG: hypothetical protein RJA70_1763 [Pseudomonadota bacterium]